MATRAFVRALSLSGLMGLLAVPMALAGLANGNFDQYLTGWTAEAYDDRLGRFVAASPQSISAVGGMASLRSDADSNVWYLLSLSQSIDLPAATPITIDFDYAWLPTNPAADAFSALIEWNGGAIDLFGGMGNAEIAAGRHRSLDISGAARLRVLLSFLLNDHDNPIATADRLSIDNVRLQSAGVDLPTPAPLLLLAPLAALLPLRRARHRQRVLTLTLVLGLAGASAGAAERIWTRADVGIDIIYGSVQTSRLQAAYVANGTLTNNTGAVTTGVLRVTVNRSNSSPITYDGLDTGNRPYILLNGGAPVTLQPGQSIPFSIPFRIVRGALTYAVWPEVQKQLSQALSALTPNQWVKIDTFSVSGWSMAEHGSAVYDSNRGNVLYFGSDTHGTNHNNAILEWSPFTWLERRYYAQSNTSTYHRDPGGFCIAGTDADPFPTAMHSYDSAEFDPVRDRLIVDSTDVHNSTAVGKCGPLKANAWYYDLTRRRWTPASPGHTSFAHGSASDGANTFLTVYNRGVGILNLQTDTWTNLGGAYVGEIHYTVSYDSLHKVYLVFGDYNRGGFANRIRVYHPGNPVTVYGFWEYLTPAGMVLDEHYPVAYTDKDHVHLMVVNPAGSTVAKTYFYDYGKAQLTAVPSAGFPFIQTMNYKMVYDPHHDVFLLTYTNGLTPTTSHVYALKLDVSRL